MHAIKIVTLNPNDTPLERAGNVDLAVSIIACGFHYLTHTYGVIFKRQVNPGGRIAMDIRKRVWPHPVHAPFRGGGDAEKDVEVLDDPRPEEGGRRVSLTQTELRDILSALDRDEADRVADLNGTAPELTAALQKRFSCRVDLVAVSPEGQRTAVTGEPVASYHKAVVSHGGVPENTGAAISNRRIRPYDVISALEGSGLSSEINHLRDFLEKSFMGRAGWFWTSSSGQAASRS